MEEEKYLDYNKFIKVEYIIDDSAIDFQFIVETHDEKLNKKLDDVLENISTVEETDTQYKIFLNGVEFISISKENEEIEFKNKLTTTEMRLLTRDNLDIAVPFLREENNAYKPKSDLNSSFDGAIMSESLIRIGQENDLKYPISLLEEIGIDIEKYNSIIDYDNPNYINLKLLEKEDIDILEENLKMSPLTIETSKELNKIYRLREPFTKSKDLFTKYLEEIAQNYKNNGIEYAELSFAGFLEDSEYVHILDETLPQIEEKYGVNLRFLVELSGNSNNELREENIEVIKRLTGSSPYIIGCDMKRGRNQEEIYKEELEELTRYAIQNPEFVIKVNAGETQRQQKNISRILKTVSDEHDKLGKTLPYPHLHIGSGIYGWKKTDLEKARDMDVMVIFDISASLANNNVYSIIDSDSPIKRCLNQKRVERKTKKEHRIGVAFGTSGMGIYSTSPQEELLLAQALGVNKKELEKIQNDEEKYIGSKKENNIEVKDETDKIEEGIAKASDAKNKYKKNKETKITQIVSALKNYATELGIEIDVDKINEITNGKIPILISGASEDKWPSISPSDKRNIEITLQVLANVIDPQKVFIVTGGTNIGVERRMHEAINRRNIEIESQNDKIVILGTLTLEAAKNDLEGIEGNTITHALILDENGKAIETWDEFPNAQLEYVKNREGILIAIGGGPAVSDMIELASKKDIQKHLMDGPAGASTEKSKTYKKDSFKIVEELITKLYESNPNIFKKDIIKFKEDGKTLDIVSIIEEAKKEIEETHKLENRFSYRALSRNGHDFDSVNNGSTIYSKAHYETNKIKIENYYSMDIGTHISLGSIDSKYISSTKKIGIVKHKYSYNDFYSKDIKDTKRTPIVLIDRTKLKHAEYDLSDDEKIMEIREFKESRKHYKSNFDKTKADKEVIIEEEIPSDAYKVVPPILVDVLDVFERNSEDFCQSAINEMIITGSINDNGQTKNIEEFLNDVIKELELNDVEKFAIQEYYNNMYNMQTVANKFKATCIDDNNISDEMILKTLTGVKMQIVKKFMQNKKLQDKIEELKIAEMQKIGVTPRLTNYKNILNKSYDFTEGTVSATSQQKYYGYGPKSDFIVESQGLKVNVKKDTRVVLPIGIDYDLEQHKIKLKNFVLEKEEAGVYPGFERDVFGDPIIQKRTEIDFDPIKLKKYIISVKEQELQQREQMEAECDRELRVLEQGLSIGD